MHEIMKFLFTATLAAFHLASTANGVRLGKDPNPADASSTANGVNGKNPALDTSFFSTYIDEVHPRHDGQANGLHLHQDAGSAYETADTLMNIMEYCPAEAADLEMCYADKGAASKDCVNCYVPTLSQTRVDCDGLQDDLDALVATCDSCLTECDEEQASLITCAASLYCPEPEGNDGEPIKLVGTRFIDSGLQCLPDGSRCYHNNACCSNSCTKNGFVKFCEWSSETTPPLGGGCFSLESTVVVKGKGAASIKDLVMGDMVLSNEKGTYSKYYSKGHYNEKSLTEFVRIHNELNTKPLELTPGHMLYLALDKLPVPAHAVKVGDVLRTADGPSKVTAIRKISRKGLANPVTLSGSIVVDGIVSSVHSEESGFEGSDAGWIYLSGVKIVHWHTLMHFIHAPHRIVCGRFMACTEKLTEDGFVPFHQYLTNLHDTAEQKQSVVLSVLILMLVVAQTAFFSVLELLMQHAVVITFAVTCFIVGNWMASASFVKKAKAKAA